MPPEKNAEKEELGDRHTCWRIVTLEPVANDANREFIVETAGREKLGKMRNSGKDQNSKRK
jgi:hypothetical protein